MGDCPLGALCWNCACLPSGPGWLRDRSECRALGSLLCAQALHHAFCWAHVVTRWTNLRLTLGAALMPAHLLCPQQSQWVFNEILSVFAFLPALHGEASLSLLPVG